MATYIKTINDRDGNVVLPRTRVEAITVSDGGPLYIGGIKCQILY